MNFNDIIFGGVIGFVVGDALGVPVEFLSRNQLANKPLTDMIEYGTHGQPKGTWSDDTSMVLATMDSIIQNGSMNYEDIMKKYCEWLQTAKYTATDIVFDVGFTTRNAISKYVYYKTDPIKCGDTGINQNGNGSLMRMLPVVYYLISKKCSDEEATKIIDEYSSITHAHEISRLGCKIFYDYILLLIQNKMDKDLALSGLKNKKYSEHYSNESINYYKRILDGSIKEQSVDSIRGSGFVRDTLEATIWATVNSNSYKEAVLKAINLGEDTDTVGALTGSINGIIYGKKSIPVNWQHDIIKSDYINNLCLKFCNKMVNSKTTSVNHTEAYNHIMKQLKARRNELNFDVNLLLLLTDDERREVEKLVSKCILNLNNTSYKYMPYLKYEKIDIRAVYDKLQRLSINDWLKFCENYYCLTKDIGIYNRIKNMAKDRVEAFVSLLNIFRKYPGNLEIEKDIKEIYSLKTNDNVYNIMYSLVFPLTNVQKK